ncbi:DUF4978 domain-containing protein [Streptomyces sp. NPDC053750]|uniref:DUF4978 domain-containing protein n=1 Tax=Streptomyces sp. NPDC053750 TaxID=3365714 RepID=UPI0037D353FD
MAKPADEKPVVVSSVAHNGTKGYLEVDGKPFPISGVQNFGEWQLYGNGLDPANIPTDRSNQILDEAWLENAFEKTAAAGFRTAQIELGWNTIQPEREGEYDWHIIDKYVEWGKKYDLKLDFVWFGSNGVGGAVIDGEHNGYISTVPTYLEDPKYWQENADGSPVRVSGDQRHPPKLPIPGEPYYDDARYLFDQEQAAVHAMFDHLAEVDTTHQTILFQLYNEPDAYPYFSTGGIETTVWRQLVDELGAAIKTSNYVVATRMNFQRGNFANDDRRARYATFLSENVDFIGVDSYDHNPMNQVGYINMVHETGSPIAYIPETGGNSNEKSPVLASVLAAGGFVDFWMLNDAWATTGTEETGIRSGFSLYGDDSNVENFQHYYDWELGTIPAMPVSTQRLRNFLVSMEQMPELVAKAEVGTMAAFNASKTASDQPTQATETVSLPGGDVTFSTTTKDVGFALYDEDTLSTYVISDTFGDVEFTVDTDNPVAEVGSFDEDGVWIPEGTLEVASDGSFHVGKGQLARVISAGTDQLSSVVSVEARCVAQKAMLAVSAVNTNEAPVTIELTTPYGPKTFANVPPGKSVFQSFTTRVRDLASGAVDATVTSDVDGAPPTGTVTQTYSGHTC